MKRTRLSRGKLARCCGRHASLCTCGQPPKLARSRLKPARPDRRAHLRERNFGEWADVVVRMPCLNCGHTGETDPAHTEGRKMGGCGGDKRMILPLCRSNPATGREGCHERYDNHRLHRGRDPEAGIVTREEARVAALRLFLDHHPDDVVARDRLERYERRPA